ncbi:MAG: hypothetical protein ACRDDL_06640 [Sarcina sp.]
MKKGIIVIIILVILGGVGYGAYKEFSSSNTPTKVSTTEIGHVQPSNTATQSSNNSSTIKSLGNTNSNNTSSKDNNLNSNTNSGQKNDKPSNVSTTSNTSTPNNTQKGTTVAKNTATTGNGNPIVYGDAIPGTNQISFNIIQIQGAIYPKSAQKFISLVKQTTSPVTEGKVTISVNTPYVEYSGANNLYKYYIINPYKLNNGGYSTTESLNKNNPTQTVFNGHENNLTAIGYIQGGIIIAVNSNGATVYVSASSLKNNITFERGNIQYFCANATVIQDEVPVRDEPAEIPTSNTIGNEITQKGLKVVADAEVNGFTRIIFGTSHGIFQGWVPSTSINIENYS